MWQNTLNGVLGLIVILIGFLGLSSVALTWTLAITGLVIAILGFWGSSSQLSSYDKREHLTR